MSLRPAATSGSGVRPPRRVRGLQQVGSDADPDQHPDDLRRTGAVAAGPRGRQMSYRELDFIFVANADRDNRAHLVMRINASLEPMTLQYALKHVWKKMQLMIIEFAQFAGFAWA